MALNCLTQKVELNYLIPAIRKELIFILEKQGLKDAEIARKLNITRSAVSQYKHKKRGHKLKFPAKLKKEIKKSSIQIMKGKSASTQIYNLINKAKQCRYICEVCKECECK